MSDYRFVREVDMDFESAVETVKERLREQGFGILTTIDIHQTLHENLSIDFKNYVIVGACDPLNACKALLAEEDSGLMLPCNVVVYERQGRTVVAAMRPTVAMEMTDNLDLRRIAKDAERRLKHVNDSLQPVQAVP
jgi:uncharacterized protein (DUF302 family)